MNNTKKQLTISIEPSIWKQAKELFSSLGLTMGEATELFYRKALHCHGLPFKVSLSPCDGEPKGKTSMARSALYKEK